MASEALLGWPRHGSNRRLLTPRDSPDIAMRTAPALLAWCAIWGSTRKAMSWGISQYYQQKLRMATNITKHLRPATRWLYGFGAVAFGVKDNGFSYFLMFYYNQVLGLPGALAGNAPIFGVFVWSSSAMNVKKLLNVYLMLFKKTTKYDNDSLWSSRF